jgi:hypothetical protein
MLSNLKIFTIAILMRTVMHRRFNIIQYEALFLLVAGACSLTASNTAVRLSSVQCVVPGRHAVCSQLPYTAWSDC